MIARKRLRDQAIKIIFQLKRTLSTNDKEFNKEWVTNFIKEDTEYKMFMKQLLEEYLKCRMPVPRHCIVLEFLRKVLKGIVLKVSTCFFRTNVLDNKKTTLCEQRWFSKDELNYDHYT